MLRRAWLAGGLLLLAGGCAIGRAGPRSLTVTLARVQETVNTRFPREFQVLHLMEFVLQAPQLSTEPQLNALVAAIPIRARGPLLGGDFPVRAVVSFGLRYEASDRTLRADHLYLRELQMPGMPPGSAGQLGPQLSSAIKSTLREEIVLYHLQDKDLTLMDTLGLQPGRITVEPEGLRVQLVPRPLADRV